MDISSIIKKDYLAFQDEVPLTEILSQLKTNEKRAALIFRKEKYVGLIERKKLIRNNIDYNSSTSKFIKKTSVVDHHADLFEVAKSLYENDSDYLPVFKDKRIIGVIYSLDLISSVLKLPNLPDFHVSDVKLVKPKKLDVTDKISSVLRCMDMESVDHMPLFEDGKLAGEIQFRELLKKHIQWTKRRDTSGKFNAELKSRGSSSDLVKLSDLPAQDFMEVNVEKIKPSMKLKSALSKLVSSNVRNLVVTDQGKYQGLFVSREILRTLSRVKVVKEYNLRFSGLGNANLTDHQDMLLKKISNNLASKLVPRIGPFKMEVSLKSHLKDGKQNLYEVFLKMDLNGTFRSISKQDWDLETALRKCFNGILRNYKK